MHLVKVFFKKNALRERISMEFCGLAGKYDNCSASNNTSFFLLISQKKTILVRLLFIYRRNSQPLLRWLYFY